MAGSSALYSLGTRGPDNLYPRRDNRVRREAMLGAAAASTASLVSNPFDTVRDQCEVLPLHLDSP